MAYQETKSPKYCGPEGSNASVAIGSPASLTSIMRRRARVMPSPIRNDPSMPGSLMNPFHPVTVRGFSKYTRITR